MDKNSICCDKIEFQELLLCNNCNKCNKLPSNDINIVLSEQIISQNRKYISYNYTQIQNKNIINKRKSNNKFIILLLFLFLNIIILSFYFSNKKILGKEKEKSKRNLDYNSLIISLKLDDITDSTIKVISSQYYKYPYKISIINETYSENIYCENCDTNQVQVNCTIDTIKLYFDFNNNPPPENMNFSKMFLNCTDIKEITLEGSDQLQIISTYQMFKSCKSLTNINFINISFTEVESMEEMFFNCESLLSIDMSDLNLNKVLSTKNMFKGCKSLTTVDFSNNELENLKTAEGMFKDCHSLKSVNLTDSNTNSLENIAYMFYG